VPDLRRACNERINEAKTVETVQQDCVAVSRFRSCSSVSMLA
jgi:hypothetical protein